MYIKILSFTAIAALALPGVASAQNPSSTLCKQVACRVAFEWSTNEAPDPDRIYGSPGDLEGTFVSRLQELGYDIEDHARSFMTVRITMQKSANCDAVPGMNPDTTCHAPAWASVAFTSADSSAHAHVAVDVHPRCVNSTIFPKMRAFGKFAAEMVDYALNGEKGDRPRVKC